MDERLLQAEANQQAWTRLHMAVLGGKLYHNQNAEWSVNARPSGGNLVIAKAFSGAETVVEGEIEDILRAYQEVGLAATWELGPSCGPPNLTKILRARHLMGPTYLHLHWIDLNRQPEGSVHYAEQIDDWNQFGRTRHPLVEWIAKSKQPDFLALQSEISDAAGSNLVHLAIRADGKIAACASIFLTGSVAGIYAVVVLKEMRGRGLGSAITSAALHRARELGASHATLQCMRRTTPFYERLGFEAVGTMATMYYSKERSMKDSVSLFSRQP